MAPRQDEVISKIIKSIVTLSKEQLLARQKDVSQDQSKSDIVYTSPQIQSQTEDGTPKEFSNIFSCGIASRIPAFEIRDTLAAFMIRAIVLDKKYQFNIEHEMSAADVQRLIKICVDKICSQDDMEMKIIKMQVYFDTNFPSQNDFLYKEKHSRLDNCSNILRDIVEVKNKNISHFESLNRKIVTYILLRSNCGKVSDVEVIREATAALESVFPNSELAAFISLPRQEKDAQLNGLTNLVTGIRLFNKHLGKVPELCLSEFREFSLMVKEQTEKTEKAIQLYKDYSVKNPRSEVTESMADLFTLALAFQRQYLLYLDALQEQVDSSGMMMESMRTRFDDILKDLQFVCKSKSAVPVDQVYPLFISLATLWYSWFDLLFLLAFRRGIVETLIGYSNFEMPITSIILTLSNDLMADIEPENLTEQEIIQNATILMKKLIPINSNIDIIHPGNTTNYYKLLVEFGGFCPYNLCNRNGLPVPGDKNIGLIRYKDRLFSCTDHSSAMEFCKNPDHYIQKVVELSKSKPSYVQLLHLYKMFPSVDTLEKAQSFSRQQVLGQLPIVSEIGCQVDTHIEETNINRNYKWNEWDLRRHALMLVNLKDKRTHSSQTDQSHFRRESETQHYVPKSNYSQTKRSSSTFVPKTKHFLAGLRNNTVAIPRELYQNPKHRDYHFKIFDMTIDQDGGPVPYGGGALETKKKVEKGV